MVVALSKVMTRGIPVGIASMFLHVGVAAGLVVVAGGGHRPAGSPMQLIDVDVATVVETPPVETSPQVLPTTSQDRKPSSFSSAPPPPTHSHPYEVPPSHDAHPHDPSFVHEVAGRTPASAEPPVLDSAAAASPPTFKITLGGKGPVGGSTSESLAEQGAGTSGNHERSDIPVAESAVSKKATLVASAPASYPNEARMSELEADVPLEIIVDANGVVVDARVVQHRGSGFDESALAAIRRYRFKPAERNGHVVMVKMQWSVQFRLH